jgi:hypothetical protein
VSDKSEESNAITADSALDELTSRLRIIESSTHEHKAEIDWTTALLENWQRLLIGVVILLLLVWLGSEVLSSKRRNLEAVSDRFSNAQEQYSSFINSAKQDESLKRAVEDSLSSVRELDQSNFYAKSAELYQGTFKKLNGQNEEASKIYQELAVLAKAGDSKFDGDKLIAELATLNAARVLLDSGVEKEAKAKLVEVAKNGTFSAVEAVAILARIASDEQSRSEARDQALALIKRLPELSSIIKDAVTEFGIEL